MQSKSPAVGNLGREEGERREQPPAADVLMESMTPTTIIASVASLLDVIVAYSEALEDQHLLNVIHLDVILLDRCHDAQTRRLVNATFEGYLGTFGAGMSALRITVGRSSRSCVQSATQSSFSLSKNMP